MAATVLNSPRAVQMSVFVVRAFVRMRAALTNTAALEETGLAGENRSLAGLLEYRQFPEFRHLNMWTRWSGP